MVQLYEPFNRRTKVGQLIRNDMLFEPMRGNCAIPGETQQTLRPDLRQLADLCMLSRCRCMKRITIGGILRTIDYSQQTIAHCHATALQLRSSDEMKE